MNHFQMTVGAGELVEDLRGGILGAVVDGNNFIVWIVLREQSGESVRELFGFVAGRKEHREPGTVPIKSRGDVGEPGETANSANNTEALGNPEESADRKECSAK